MNYRCILLACVSLISLVGCTKGPVEEKKITHTPTFVAVRKYAVCSASEAIDLIQCQFVPILEQVEGFKSLNVIEVDPQTIIAISSFHSKESANKSTDLALDWIRNCTVNIFCKPEVSVGELRIHVTK